jgi:hypothetical protein
MLFNLKHTKILIKYEKSQVKELLVSPIGDKKKTWESRGGEILYTHSRSRFS